jgi:hypothetical protein
MDCQTLREKAPSCFKRIDVVAVQGATLPNYAQAYACLWELSLVFNTTFAEVIQDESLLERVMQCRRQFSPR